LDGRLRTAAALEMTNEPQVPRSQEHHYFIPPSLDFSKIEMQFFGRHRPSKTKADSKS